MEWDAARFDALKRRCAGASVQPIRADVRTFPLAAQRYSVILASAVLHFFTPTELAVLAPRITDALLPGGLFFAAAFTRDDPSAIDEQVPHPDLVRHFFHRDELLKLFRPLEVLFYEESRRAAHQYSYGYRSGATLIARRTADPPREEHLPAGER